MRTIRASEIGAYLFCQRAWWYQCRGEVSANQADMARGSTIHFRHRRAVLQAGCLKAVAYGLILAALILATIYLTRLAL